MTSFLRAVQLGDLDLIRNRISASADLLYCSNRHGDTPLLVAARHGHVTILRFLAEDCKVSLTQSNVDGKTALHEAACSEQLEAVQFLCGRNIKIDCLKRADWTPLMMACTKSRQDVVATLVNAGADISLRNKDGWNSFHIACREGHPTIINYLLDVGSDCWRTVSHNKRTPLHTVALNGRLNAVKILQSRSHYYETTDIM
jgi:ankyrin repeat protein